MYLDTATAAPLHPVARQALLAALDDGWADPGKLYTHARRARQLLDAAQAAAADVLSVLPEHVRFCASGTDAVRQAVLGTVAARDLRHPIVVAGAVEHSAVLHAARAVGRCVEVPVDSFGRVDLAAFAAAVQTPVTGAPGVSATTEVALAAVQTANHEVGTTQPVAEAALLCADAAVPLLVDAAQSLGRVPTPDGWSLLVASARKWGGPAGVGLLVVRPGTRWQAPDPAAGPVSVPAVVAAAASLRAVHASADADSARLRQLTATIRTRVAQLADVELVGDPDDRLPHIVTFSCMYLDGETLLHELDRLGFAVSSGSACTSDTLRPSHVLAAMGVLTHGNVRVSLHTGVSEQDVAAFLDALPIALARLRAQAGVTGL